MKILIIMDPGILIPVTGYGGHERLVEMFAKEYTRLGHEVHLLVTTGSHVQGCVMHGLGKEGFPPPKKDRNKTMLKAWRFLWKHKNDYDLIHNFGRLAYLLPVLNNSVKKIMTYGRIVSAKNIKWINKIPNKQLKFTAPSDWCKHTGNVAGEWHTVYNAIDFSIYDLNPETKDSSPLIFLSRIEKLKGAHIAIQVALETDNKLIIAGNRSPLKEEQDYFDNEIQPFIDNEQIIYVGTLNDADKNKYLQLAKAMLFPASTEEAFGMVLVEAMACGTPVIGFRVAAIPEVITVGVTGFVVKDKTEMKEALNNTYLISRRDCREAAKKKFDVKVIANQYLSLFE